MHIRFISIFVNSGEPAKVDSTLKLVFSQNEYVGVATEQTRVFVALCSGCYVCLCFFVAASNVERFLIIKDLQT